MGFGGTERVFLSVGSYLMRARGFSVGIVVDRLDGSETEEIAREAGFKLYSLDCSRTFQSVRPFAELLRTVSPDVVVSAYTETNAAALMARFFSGSAAKIVVTEHASLDDHWRKKSLMRRLILESIVKFCYPWADGIFCVSKGMARQVAGRMNRESIPHIYNPVRFGSPRRVGKLKARSSLGLSLSEKLILSVGRVSRQKNYSLLLDAFSRLDDPSIRLMIVGGIYEPAEYQRLLGMMSQLGLDGRVSFVEFTHDIELYYEAADALVLSSAWEGFGNVIVEALAFGLPVVSTRCPHGPEEILDGGRFGRLVELNDPTAMAHAISETLTESSNSRPLIDRASEFSEESIGEQYYQFIKRIVGGGCGY